MAWSDILGNEKEIEDIPTESILESMKYNIKEKEKMIEDLVKKITILERKLEHIEHNIT